MDSASEDSPLPTQNDLDVALAELIQRQLPDMRAVEHALKRGQALVDALPLARPSVASNGTHWLSGLVRALLATAPSDASQNAWLEVTLSAARPVLCALNDLLPQALVSLTLTLALNNNVPAADISALAHPDTQAGVFQQVATAVLEQHATAQAGLDCVMDSLIQASQTDAVLARCNVLRECT